MLWVAICFSAAALVERPVWKGLVVVVVGLSMLRPVWAIGLLLLLMPWFGGSHPGTNFTLRFFIILWGICLGGGFNLLWFQYAKPQSFQMDWRNPVVFAIFIFWLASALSLSTTTVDQSLLAVIFPNPSEMHRLLLMFHGSPLYSWWSFFALSAALWIGYFMLVLCQRGPMAAQFFVKCLGIGALVSMGFGLADYFDLIDITSFRPKEYLPGWRSERLTSAFGNPGWYAQYIVLSAPAILSLFFIQVRRWIVLTALFAVVVFTEVTIVFISQRGGWLSYPMTLVIIWFCIYALKHAEALDLRHFMMAFRRAGLKIAISLPVTLGITLLVVSWLNQSNGEAAGRMDLIKGRLDTMTQHRDRTAYFEPSLKIWSLHPLYGGGSDGFYNLYEKEFLHQGHACKHEDPYTHQFHGTAHNLYLQTLTGKGIMGLLALLFLMATSMVVSLKSFSRVQRPCLVGSEYNRRILLMAGFAFTAAMVIYSNVGEIFYVPANYMVFNVFMAALITASHGTVRLSSNTCQSILLVVGFAFIVHWAMERFGIIESCAFS